MTVAPYKDDALTNDHSYYGRGCKNGWGTSGEEGSQTPCADSDAGGRYVTTADGETQKNGTYFNFQAATVGAGGAMATDKTDSSYTFCPLGWQMPYDDTGGDYYDKSWGEIIQLYQNSGGHSGPTMRSYPISIIPSGEFIWRLGMLYYQNLRGVLWSGIKVRNENANAVIFFKTSDPIFSENYYPSGNAVRCM